MGNCAGYCNGQGENEESQIRQSFNKQDMINNQHNNFEEKYGTSLPQKAFIRAIHFFWCGPTSN